MNDKRRLALSLAMTALFAGALGPSRAGEAACNDWECDVVRLACNTEEPDPVSIWRGINDLPEMPMLNPGGDVRGDGVPSIVMDPSTGWLIAVWAYNRGTDHDIAMREWRAIGWGPLVFLSSTVADDIDPRLTRASDGTLHVVWWQREDQQVLLTSRPSTFAPWSPPRVVQSRARRPSALMIGSSLFVSFEQNGGSGQQVVVMTLEPGMIPQLYVVAETLRKMPLDARLHRYANKVWIDWKHTADRIGFSEFQNGAWSPTVRWVSWPDPSLSGESRSREEVLAAIVDRRR